MGVDGKPVATAGPATPAVQQDEVVAAVSSELQDKGFLVTSLDSVLN